MTDNLDKPIRKDLFLAGGIFLFCCFGIIIIPELGYRLGFLWLFTVPFVVLILVGLGIVGVIGLWRAKQQNIQSSSLHKAFLWLAIIGILWGFLAYSLANLTFDAYMHKEFDSVIWKSADWRTSDLRARMLDDLTTNVLLEQTIEETLLLLGEPDRILEYDQDSNEESLIYYFGDGAMSIGYDCLMISFDEDGELLDFGTLTCD